MGCNFIKDYDSDEDLPVKQLRYSITFLIERIKNTDI